MELQILSVSCNTTYAVSWISVVTTLGSIVICDNHEPFVGMLAPGSEAVFLVDNNQKKSIVIYKGVIEVTRLKVTLLIYEL